MAAIRIATFNLENFDETAPNQRPSLAERIALMKPQIVRLRADIVCFQEVNGQERPGQPRALLALADLLAGTNLQGSSVTSTGPAGGGVYDERNLAVVTQLPVTTAAQRSTTKSFTTNPSPSPPTVSTPNPTTHPWWPPSSSRVRAATGLVGACSLAGRFMLSPGLCCGSAGSIPSVRRITIARWHPASTRQPEDEHGSRSPPRRSS
jgi:hypothetical protein